MKDSGRWTSFLEGSCPRWLRTTRGPTSPRLADVYSALAEMSGFFLFLFILSAMCTDYPRPEVARLSNRPFPISQQFCFLLLHVRASVLETASRRREISECAISIGLSRNLSFSGFLNSALIQSRVTPDEDGRTWRYNITRRRVFDKRGGGGQRTRGEAKSQISLSAIMHTT